MLGFLLLLKLAVRGERGHEILIVLFRVIIQVENELFIGNKECGRGPQRRVRPDRHRHVLIWDIRGDILVPRCLIGHVRIR